jgi:hypothetical protein
VVDKLDSGAGGDAQLRQELALAQQEAKLNKEFAQQWTADMDRMHRQGAKNADNIREMSSTFQELIDSLCDLSLQIRDSAAQSGEGSGSPQVALESAALEQELGDCYDRFQSIGDASDSVQMQRRSGEAEVGLGTSGAMVGSRLDRASSRTLSSNLQPESIVLFRSECGHDV